MASNRAKARNLLGDAIDLLNHASDELDGGDLDEAEALLAEALDIAGDAMALVDKEQGKFDPEQPT